MPDPGARENPQAAAGAIRVGPAGWSYADWSGIVYPARKPSGFHEAAFLSEFFDTIEINTSFYQPVRPDHCRHWLELVSANPRFLFTAKLWQKFTHEEAAGPEDEKAVRVGFDVLRGAGKLGAVLLQFPFSFHRTEENTAYLAKLLKKFSDYPLVVEVRHATWNDKSFYAMLHERGVGFCNIDQPVIGRSMKPTERATSRVAYVRLHGRRYDTWFSDDPATPPSERYNYLYTESELEPWAARIRHVSQGGESTFVIANNHFEGKGVVNALQLVHLLTQSKVKVPEILRQHYPELDRIASEPPAEPLLFPMS
ncbi:MAG TPA: DUF72 domain-containing protein [Candidatus Acidoferrales bacterium]|nr:DUF72 domain-containing protein [Candidatus Acidoferrales bacterium]